MSKNTKFDENPSGPAGAKNPKGYPDAAENAARVVELGGTVMHGVDATALESCKALKGVTFDSVVFNYPHLGSGEQDQDRNGASAKRTIC